MLVKNPFSCLSPNNSKDRRSHQLVIAWANGRGTKQGSWSTKAGDASLCCLPWGHEDRLPWQPVAQRQCNRHCGSCQGTKFIESGTDQIPWKWVSTCGRVPRETDPIKRQPVFTCVGHRFTLDPNRFTGSKDYNWKGSHSLTEKMSLDPGSGEPISLFTYFFLVFSFYFMFLIRMWACQGFPSSWRF